MTFSNDCLQDEWKNYALEAVHLLMQCEYILSPRLKAQLTWSRFVNVHGKPRPNIPCDLQMEHMNTGNLYMHN